MNKYFRYPVEYVGISQRYKPNSHYGTDFGWNSGYMPMKIFAASEGVVTVASESEAIGNYVVIKHGTLNGKDIYTQYKHLESYSVKVGDHVTMSTQIGIMGATGKECAGRHLHFDYIPVPAGKPFTQTYRINPEPYLYAYKDILVGANGQDGVTINKLDMTVAEGEKVVVEEPKPTPTPKPEPIDTDTYKVVKGDTLSSIANRFGISLKEIIELNPQIKNPNLIYPGQDIFVKKPEKRVYTVVKGDTLTKIANAYGTTVANLVELNKIENPNLIYPGQVIKLN